MSGSDALTVLSLPFGGAYLGLAPQEPSGPPKFLTLLSTHTTLFVDPDRPSGNSPKRFLCVGFWGVKPIAVCMSRDHGAVSSFRECGLPYGLRGALCTLHPCCSVCTSFTGATLGRSGWLDLPPQGLTPCKKHQASLGALTLAVSRAQWRERRRSGRYWASAPTLHALRAVPTTETGPPWCIVGQSDHALRPDQALVSVIPRSNMVLDHACVRHRWP
jgi:hypothetical protein